MTPGTYCRLEREDYDAIKALEHRMDMDETVPDDMVRLAGNRYITRQAFQRQLRREMKRR